jgi:hypothetical protein
VSVELLLTVRERERERGERGRGESERKEKETRGRKKQNAKKKLFPFFNFSSSFFSVPVAPLLSFLGAIYSDFVPLVSKRKASVPSLSRKGEEGRRRASPAAWARLPNAFDGVTGFQPDLDPPPCVLELSLFILPPHLLHVEESGGAGREEDGEKKKGRRKGGKTCGIFFLNEKTESGLLF